MTFQENLTDIRKRAITERDKGTRFERLMRAYLLTDPLYATTLNTFWLWSDFPFRKDFSGKDTGIDLIAKTVSGEYWAIQCKCFAEDAYIRNKAAHGHFEEFSRSDVSSMLQGVTAFLQDYSV